MIVNETANNTAAQPLAAGPQDSEPKNRPGAPRGNSNAMRAGFKATKIPEGCKSEENEIYALRREVLAELIAMHGSIDAIPLLPLAIVQSLVRHETRARLAARWLRENGDTLPLADRLSLLATISAATDARDKCLERAGFTIDVLNRGGQQRKDDGLSSLDPSKFFFDVEPQPTPLPATQPPQPPTDAASATAQPASQPDIIERPGQPPALAGEPG